MREAPYRIRAVLFDFDGTLTRPGSIDFAAIREAIGCPPGEPILEFIEHLSDPAERRDRMKILDGFEHDAAAASEPAEDAEEVVAALRAAGLSVGVVSRNSLAGIERAFENFPRLSAASFDIVASRDVPVPPKPQPDGVLYAAEALGVAPAEVLVVGDHPLDVAAGNAAGALTALLAPGGAAGGDAAGAGVAAGGDGAGAAAGAGVAADSAAGRDADPEATPDAGASGILGGDPGMPESAHAEGSTSPDFQLDGLADVMRVVRLGLPLPLGKFPNDLLAHYLEGAVDDDPALLIKPAVGEDVAAVDVSTEDVLVLKSDPITFVTESLGEYLVVVNANDIATSGATPRWLLATALFPAGTTPSMVIHALRDLSEACRRRAITLCGGHTEITDAVTRPVVIGTMAGTVERVDLVDKRDVLPGDRVLLTKGVAVEGTAILAAEAGGRLAALGMSAEDVAESRGLLAELSVLDEAAIAREHPGVTAMHDVTEGGLATAVRELAWAGGHGIRVDVASIPVIPLTARICGLLGLDPLGLIGSGSLLIACRSGARESLEAAIRAAGIEVACIGTVLDPGGGVEAVRDGRAVEWPAFDVDELARFFQDRLGGG